MYKLVSRVLLIRHNDILAVHSWNHQCDLNSNELLSRDQVESQFKDPVREWELLMHGKKVGGEARGGGNGRMKQQKCTTNTLVLLGLIKKIHQTKQHDTDDLNVLESLQPGDPSFANATLSLPHDSIIFLLWESGIWHQQLRNTTEENRKQPISSHFSRPTRKQSNQQHLI